MRRVEIRASRRYAALIETGLLERAGQLLREKTAAETVCIVSGQQVWPLYGQRLEQSLHAAGFRTLRFVHPRTGEPVEVTSELPDYFKEVLSKLGPEL